MKQRHFRVAVVLLLGGILGWGTLFSATQHVKWTAGLYWAMATASTVGYGDVVPRDDSGRLIAIGAMLTLIPALGAIFTWMTGQHLRRHLAEHREHMERRLEEHLQQIRGIRK